MAARPPKRIEAITRGLAFREGRILLCRNTSHGLSYLPGGHVDPGETAAEALVREFDEETGLRVKCGEFLHAQEHIFTQQGTPRHEWNAVFHVEPPAGGWPESVESREPDLRFEWCEIAALPEAKFVPAPLLAWFLAGHPREPIERLDEAWISHREAE